MFKNREFRVRIAKINDNTPEATQERFTIDPEQIGDVTKDVMFVGHALTKDLVKHTAKAVAGVIVLTVVASTIGDVIVNKSKN